MKITGRRSSARFDADRTLINLNNGGVAPAPSHVLEQMIRDLRFANELPAHHMWGILEPRIESVRRDLAREFGCDPEEMAITRNASEALEILILGIDLKRGDEVVVTDQNYPRMLTTWDQREPPRGDRRQEDLVRGPAPVAPTHFVDQIRRGDHAANAGDRVHPHRRTSRATSSPVREVVAMARRARASRSFIDGAHAFAHFPFTPRRPGLRLLRHEPAQVAARPDRHGLPLRPQGQDQVDLAAHGRRRTSQEDDIRKYEEIGTHPAANHNAIAVLAGVSPGDRRPSARSPGCVTLRDRWATALAQATPRARLLSPHRPKALVRSVSFTSRESIPQALKERLWDKHRILTIAIRHEEFSGLRITPNVDTSTEDVDVFVDAVLKSIKAIG